MIIRRLIVPLTVAVVMLHAGQSLAQGAFPAPLPGEPIANDPAFPPVNGGAPAASVGAPRQGSSFPVTGAPPFSGSSFERPAPPSQAGGPPEDCMKAFAPLREDAEKRGKMIKLASERHAPPDEACKLIGGFAQAETKMMEYVKVNASKCGIPPQVGDQMKAGHKNTELMLQKVCAAAQQQAQGRGPAGPSLSDVLGSAAALPEATATKKGGSTFDTLNGNVLTR